MAQRIDFKINEYKFTEFIGEPILGISQVFKRFFDVTFGLIGLILSCPLLLIFGIAIKCTSKGPVLYRQDRVGKMGKIFKVIKLRSMYQNAESKTGAVWAKKNDSRITPVGRFMRKTRIDELPQFWNVIKGDMSLVGPRPERPLLTEEFTKQNKNFPKRLRIVPGITGYAQINGGYDIGPDEKAKLDNYYIEHYSLFFDLKVIFGTIRIIFTGDGAR